MNTEKLRILVENMAEINKLSNSFCQWEMEELIACYELLLNKYAPFKIGDKVKLTGTPVIPTGWITSAYFLFEGSTGFVHAINCGKGGFRFDIVFDNESCKNADEKHTYSFSEEWLEKCESEGSRMLVEPNNFTELEWVVLDWWRGKRPCSYTEDEHLKNPLVNCIGEGEKGLALQAKKIIESRGEIMNL